MKIAIVHSWLNQYGGAERVLEAIHEIFPDAPIYTSIYDPYALPAIYRTWDIRVSFLNRLPAAHRHHQIYLPLYPFAFQSLNLRDFDLVLSMPSAFAHGVTLASTTRHVCYCLTPARFLWQYQEYVENEAIGRIGRVLLPHLVAPLRYWDQRAAQRVNEFIAISRTVQTRIFQSYHRDSTIIYPPVHTEHFHPVAPTEVKDYFLIVSRLVPYKRVHLAVEAFNQLGWPLIVAGDGRDRARLEKMANPNIRFVGRVPDVTRRDLMTRCRALIFPGEEDFGITPLEANASGRPVIAYAGGGALDTIIEGTNGALFHEATVSALLECVRAFDAEAFDTQVLCAHAEKFSTRIFQHELHKHIQDK